MVQSFMKSLNQLAEDMKNDLDKRVYTVEIDAHTGAVRILVDKELFRELVGENAEVKVSCETGFSVHHECHTGNLILVTCVLRFEMPGDEDELLEDIFRRWCEKTGWPYAQESTV